MSKYSLAEMEKQYDENDKVIEIADELKMIAGSEKYGEFSIKDLKEHQLLIDKQIEAIKANKDYPNAEQEIKELEANKAEEGLVIEEVIKELNLKVNE
jgi:hypothetical protein